MTLLGIIITTTAFMVVVCVSFYIGKLVGYFKGVKAMCEGLSLPFSGYMGDIPGFLKKKEEENGKSKQP